MGRVELKRINKNYSKDSDVFNIMRYSCSKKKENKNVRVRYIGTRGLPENLEDAVDSMIKTQKLMGKASGRRINHFIFSFSKVVDDAKLVYFAADRLADEIGKEYPLIYGVHEDTDNYHIHFAASTISCITGKKWHTSSKEFSSWRNKMIKIAEDVLNDWKI